MGYRSEFLTQVMFLDNFTCVYCGKHSHDLTIDHYIPQSLGGPDIIQNLVACCSSCNSSKNSKVPYEWGQMARHGRFERIAPPVLFKIHTEEKVVYRDKSKTPFPILLSQYAIAMALILVIASLAGVQPVLWAVGCVSLCASLMQAGGTLVKVGILKHNQKMKRIKNAQTF